MSPRTPVAGDHATETPRAGANLWVCATLSAFEPHSRSGLELAASRGPILALFAGSVQIRIVENS